MSRISQLQALKEMALFCGLDGLFLPHSALLCEDDILLLFAILEISRVGIATPPVPKSLHWYSNVLTCLDEGRFRCQLRMDRDCFTYLVNHLSGIYSQTILI